MDTKTLIDALSGEYPAPTSQVNYAEMLPEVERALKMANCTTPKRIAMFLAQIGAESGSLRWMEELADGSAYNGRTDLGNIYPGDGPRFKGRGPIQVTGRHNYGVLSQWAYKKKYVPTRTYFVDHPEQLAWRKYRWLGAIWYWTVARPMNKYADNMDILGATIAVNGGTNNLAGRTARWRHALSLGNRLQLGDVITVNSKYPMILTPWKVFGPPPKKKNGNIVSGTTTWQRVRIKFIQERLKDFGWYTGKIDGIYGPSTAKAVLDMKHYHKLRGGGGTCGIKTWNLIRSNKLKKRPAR